MTDGGKGDWIPGTNAKAFDANYPGIDWTARDRLALHTAVIEGLAARGIDDVAVVVQAVSGGEWHISCPDLPGFMVGGHTTPTRTLADLAAIAVNVIAGAAANARKPKLLLGEWQQATPEILGFDPSGPDGDMTTARVIGPKRPAFNPDDFGVLAIEHREEPDFSLPKRAPWWRRAWERVVCFVLAPCWDP